MHVPFLARKSAEAAERISDFRATEELMLRCGSAFSEIMLLGKSLDELAGYTSRIVEMFRALRAPPASPGQPPSPHGLVHMVTSQEQRDESRNPTGLRAAFGALDDDVRINATTKDGHDDHLHHHHHHHGAL